MNTPARVSMLLEVATPYWHRLVTTTTWSAETARRAADGDSPWPPMQIALMARRWGHAWLDRFLAAVELEQDRRTRYRFDGVIRTLLGSTLPADEFESWIRWLFRGNVAAMQDRHGWMPHLRLLFPGTAVTEAARIMGIEEPADRLIFEPELHEEWQPPAFGPLYDRIPPGCPHLPGLPPGWRVKPDSDGAWLAELLAAGWPEPLLGRLVPTRDIAVRNETLRVLSRLLHLPPDGVEGWLDALTRPGEPGLQRLLALALSPELPRLVMLWRSTGLPDGLAPWCAAAGLPPEEAIALHRDGALDLGALRVLVGLQRS